MAHSIHADCMNTVGRSLSLIATIHRAQLYNGANQILELLPLLHGAQMTETAQKQAQMHLLECVRVCVNVA